MVLAERGYRIVGFLSFASRQVSRHRDKSSREGKRPARNSREQATGAARYGPRQRTWFSLWTLQLLTVDKNTSVWLLYPPQTNKEDITLPFEKKEHYWQGYIGCSLISRTTGSQSK